MATSRDWLIVVLGIAGILTCFNLRAFDDLNRHVFFYDTVTGSINVDRTSSNFNYLLAAAVVNRNTNNNTSAATSSMSRIEELLSGFPLLSSSSSSSSTQVPPNTKKKKNEKTTIAYAVSITKCLLKDNRRSTIDRAAVLHQSIKLAHGHTTTATTATTTNTTTTKTTKYDFHMHAFVHLNATDCVPILHQLGYKTHVRDTPVHTYEMTEDLASVQHNSCCGDLEWSKLYTYALTDYPVAVHLDLDTIMLKVMEDVFDLMTDQSTTTESSSVATTATEDQHTVQSNYNRSRFVDNRENAMWIRNVNELPTQVDFVFTRDYNMVNPPMKRPHQIGVQGGFLVVRPNLTEFEHLKELVRQGGDFQPKAGWGGPKGGYGGFYGAGTIQGFASYYYSEIAPNRSVELNRCHYNTMVDNPLFDRNGRMLCRTTEPDGTCQDCRTTPMTDIYTAHFTVCGKPEWCIHGHNQPLCATLFTEWHRIRYSLEVEWMDKYGPNGRYGGSYDPGLEKSLEPNSVIARERQIAEAKGHCYRRTGYSQLVLPNVTEKLM